MARKNPGELLTDKLRGMLEALPTWVRSMITVVRKHQTGIEPDVEPPSLTAGLVESSAVQEVTDERTQVTLELDPLDLPKTRTGQRVLPTGQVATVTDTADSTVLVITEDPTVVDGDVEKIGGVYIREVVTVPVFPANLFAKERPETIPQKFRAAVPLETTRIDEPGTAAEPTLGVGEVSESQEQTRVGVKRTTISTRDETVLPVTLLGQEISAEGQLAIVTETLDDTVQTVTPSPTQIEGRVENLGDGLTLKTTKVVPSVFDNALFSKERPETIPQKFRAATPLETTRLDVAGTAAEPTLVAGDVVKSSEQLRLGVKRDVVANRDVTLLPVTLLGQELTTQGQVAAVTETLDDTAQTITPSATQVEATVDNLGDGLTLKTTKVVASVFDNQLFSKEKPETIPQKFRAATPLETTRIDTAGTAAEPTLGAGEVAKTSEQIRVGVKRDTVATRDDTVLPVTLVGARITNEGQLATITEVLDDTAQTLTPSATQVAASVENLGDGLTLKTTEVVPSVFDNTLHAKERPETVPQKFRAAVPLETLRVDTPGTAAEPTLGAGEVTKTSEQIRVGVKRDSISTRDATVLPVTLLGQELTVDGQIAAVTEVLDDAPQSLAANPLQVQASVENLGDGLTLKTTKDVGVVFDKKLFSAERPETIPLKFRGAVPLTTERTDLAGTAAAPTLGVGEVSKSSEQLRVGVKRDLTALRNATLLPVVLLGQELSAQGQLVTVTETLDDTAQTTSESPTKIEAEVENLGDGITLKREKTVASVFGESLFAKERPEVLPLKFRAAIPANTTRLDSAGTAAAPTMAAGDLNKISEQIRVGVKRDTTITRSLVAPPTLTGQETIMEYGGELCNVTETIVADGTAADSGVGVVKSTVEPLGDGTSLKTSITRIAGAWPTVTDFEFDERSEAFVKVEKIVIPVASAGTPSLTLGVLTEFKGLDKWRSVQIVSKFNTTVVGTSKERKVTGKYSFPDTITRCEFVEANVSVESEYSISVSLDVDIEDGPSGAFPGRLVETFIDDPTVALPTVFVYRTTHGTISVAYVYGIFAIVNGRLAATANSHTWSIPPSLHGLLNPTLSIGSGVVILEGDGVGASNPTALNEGAEILIDVGVDKWRFNTWVLSKLYITVPTL